MLQIPSITDCVAAFSAMEVNNTRASFVSQNVAGNPALNGGIALVKLSYSQDIHNNGGDTIRNLLISSLPACQLKTRLQNGNVAIFFGDVTASRFPNVINSNSTISTSYVNNAASVIRTSGFTGQIQTDSNQMRTIGDVIATRIDWMGLAPPTANRNYSSFSLEGWLLIFGNNT